MAEVIVFPDVELWACDFVRAALADRPEPYASDVFVGASVPKVRRDRMVIARRDGGPQKDLVRESARLTLRVWAPTEKEAHDLSALVRALVTASADGKPVLKVRSISGPLRVTSDESEHPLRLLSFEVLVRGTAA